MKVEVDLTEYGVKAPKWYDPINPRVINIHNPNQMVNYSTVEQRIGTWIDGKPLYQKTFVENVTEFGTTKHFSMGISNKDLIVNGYALYNRNSGDATILNLDNNWLDFSSTDVYYCINNSALGLGTLLITIQYTKTTD